MLGPRFGKVRQDHQATLLMTLARPLGEQDFDGVAEGRFIGAAGGHRGDDAPFVAKERDVAQHMLAVLGAHAHQVLAVAAGLAHIGHQLAPLAGQQVHHVHALGRALQQGGHWREKVHVRIRGNPAALTPGQHALQFQSDLFRICPDLDHPPQGTNLEPTGDLQIRAPERQVQHRLPGYIGAIVLAAVDKVHRIVLEPAHIGYAVPVYRRQILSRAAMHVEFDRHGRLAARLDHAQGDTSASAGHRAQRS